MNVPVVPGKDDGGLDKRKMLQMAAKTGLVGPHAEHCRLTIPEVGTWWRTISEIFAAEVRDTGRIRPAFRSDTGTKLLEENFL